MHYGLIAKRKDLPSLQSQREALSECERILPEPTEETLTAIRPGFELTVYSLKCFAFERSADYQPRKVAMALLEIVEKPGVSINVINTAETYRLLEDAGRLSRDVLDALAGARQVQAGRGRPKWPAPSQDSIDEALLIWMDTVRYRTDEDARKIVKARCAYKWSNARIRKYLGPSGRKPGRK
ncbi:hypothetical protein [Roseibium sp. Sym1]|uniref:hypothetical protein n=1 Tax=Roseibium sp. Sym1 TaxID=3016006 RepID=UPI0022B4BD00|nr:hypothetical protein [Roseibium sp. Sym1]